MQSSEIIAQLAAAATNIKTLSFAEYSASEVTKALILVEMAIHQLEDAQKGSR